MPVPVPQAQGAFVESISGDISPAWPAHIAGDVGLLIVEAGTSEALQLIDFAGFKPFPNSPCMSGTRGSGAKTHLSAYWCRAAHGAMPAPTCKFMAGTDHIRGRIVTFRGCGATGNPWNVTKCNRDDSDNSDVSFDSVTTTDDECLIVYLYSNGRDSSGAQMTSWTNANLVNLIERFDDGSPIGGGSVMAMATGEKATAGATGVTTATAGGSVRDVCMTIALTPVAKPDDPTPWVANVGQEVHVSVGDPLSPAWPAHSSGDIGVLVLHGGFRPHSLSDAQGFVVIPNTQNGFGNSSGDVSLSVGISLWWKRATGSAEAAPTKLHEGGSQKAIIFTIKGCKSTGNPFGDSQSDGVEATASVSIPGGTSTEANALVIGVVTDALTNIQDYQIPDPIVNADLIDISGRYRNYLWDGMTIVSGRKVAAGAYGAFTANRVSAERMALASVDFPAQVSLFTDEALPGSIAITGHDALSQIIDAVDQGNIAITGHDAEDAFFGQIFEDELEPGSVGVVGHEAEEQVGAFTQSGFWSVQTTEPHENWTREFPDES